MRIGKPGKIFIVFMATICLLSLYGSAEAKAKKKNKKTAEPKIEAVKKEQLLKQAAAEKLGNTRWQIKITQIAAAKKKGSLKDALRFLNNKVKSESLSREGFPATSYTLSLKGENIVIWETMQTDAKGNLAFWRGEIEGEKIQGVLSRHPKDKAATDYSFVSISKETIKEEEAAVQEKETSREALKQKPAESKIKEKKKWPWWLGGGK